MEATIETLIIETSLYPEFPRVRKIETKFNVLLICADNLLSKSRTKKYEPAGNL
jgi:hypothetical protein